MTKFRFYVTTMYDGCIKGTDNVNAAESLAESEDFFIVDTETGEWLLPGGARDAVGEIPSDQG